jgi:phosphate transport system permease protein
MGIKKNSLQQEHIQSDGATSRSSSARPQGEIFVWVTAMGLSVGLVMIIMLLGFIIVEGVSVFWPKRVVQIEWDEDYPDSFRGSQFVAGVVLQEKEKDVRDLTEAQINSSNPDTRREKQLFLGNRDVYGQAFTFLMKTGIQQVTYPQNIVRAERLEYGDSIFYPLAIEENGKTLTVTGDDQFESIFSTLVKESADRWKKINRIERDEIGKINFQMRKLELEERHLVRSMNGSGSNEAELLAIQERKRRLQSLYEPLAVQAKSLRQVQESIVLRFRLATGEELVQPIGSILSYYYPNRLNVVEKVGHFFHHIWKFLSSYPREANTEGGIFPAIFGTFVMTLLMSVAVTPFGVIAAIYLREYAKQGVLVRSVRIAVNNLAGVPSIVFGVFGLGFFVYVMGGTIDQLFYAENLPDPTFKTPGILWASLTLALMTVPVVIVATEEALAAVPRGVREGALACGASKWQSIQTLVLPAAAPGIMTGLILAMARGAGEVAPLMLVGVVALAPNLPLDSVFPYFHLERKFMHLGFHIYDLGFQSPDSEAARPMVFATTLVLISLVISLNLIAIYIRNHLRKKYAVSAF